MVISYLGFERTIMHSSCEPLLDLHGAIYSKPPRSIWQACRKLAQLSSSHSRRASLQRKKRSTRSQNDGAHSSLNRFAIQDQGAEEQKDNDLLRLTSRTSSTGLCRITGGECAVFFGDISTGGSVGIEPGPTSTASSAYTVTPACPVTDKR